MGFARLFRSRWAALIWSAGILWTAYDVASDAPGPSTPTASNTAASNAAAMSPTDAVGAPVEPGDLAILANAGG